jgi:hypothetical protein
MLLLVFQDQQILEAVEELHMMGQLMVEQVAQDL